MYYYSVCSCHVMLSYSPQETKSASAAPKTIRFETTPNASHIIIIIVTVAVTIVIIVITVL